MGKREKKLATKITHARGRIFNTDDHSTAQTVIKPCTFIASLLSCVVEKRRL